MGTYSDEEIIKQLRKSNSKLIVGRTDELIKSEVIYAGLVKDVFGFFYAKNIQHEFKQAKDMGLKEFSQLSEKLHESGKDY